jgi:hypothetical protein
VFLPFKTEANHSLDLFHVHSLPGISDNGMSAAQRLFQVQQKKQEGPSVMLSEAKHLVDPLLRMARSDASLHSA